MTRSTRQSTPKVRIAALVATAALGTAAFAVAGPADARPADARPAGAVQSGYSCTVPVLGAQTVSVTTKVKLPKKVKKGAKVAARTVKLTVVLPEALVTPLRDLLHVTSLSGDATDGKLSVGSLKVALNDVKIPPTTVPASGTMTLHGKGKTSAFNASKRPGSFTIKIPKSFTFTAKDQNGQVIGGQGFPCALAPGSPSKLGSLTVTN